MPSNRAAATWHKAAAIVPIARRRCATCTSPSRARRTQRGSADSNADDLELAVGRPRRSADRRVERHAVRARRRRPRGATHSSLGPEVVHEAEDTSAIVGPSATAIDTQWCGSPRLALSEPSIGSTTTSTPSPPKSTVPRSSLIDREARSGVVQRDRAPRSTASSAAASITSVLSPPSPRVPVSSTRSATVVRAASTPAARPPPGGHAPSQSGLDAGHSRRILRTCPPSALRSERPSTIPAARC